MPPPNAELYEWRFLTLPRAALFVATVALVAGVQLERRNLIILGASLLAWMLIARLTRPNFNNLISRREHCERAFEGESLRVELTLDPAKSVGQCQCVEICDEFSAADGFYVRALLDSAFAGGKAAKLFYRPRCQRGRGLFALGPVEIRAADPTGLFEVTSLLDVFSSLIVYPRAAQLERFDPADTRVVRHLGERVDPLAGFSQEFREAREYRPGDSQRHIHWPLSARRGKLFVKAFDDSVMTEVSVFLDLGRYSRAGLGESSSEEAAIAATAAVVSFAIEQSHLASLHIVGEREMVVPSGAGQAHLQTMLNNLALARGGPREDFAEAVKPRALAMPSGSTVVLVLVATAATAEVEALLRGLEARGVRPVAVLIEDKSFHALSMEQQARRAEQRPVEEIAADWTAKGVDVFTLAKGDDLRSELERPGGADPRVAAVFAPEDQESA